MIIGNGNNSFPSEQDRFNTRMNAIQENAELGHDNKWKMLEGDPTKNYDVTNRKDMMDKSLAMLQDRLNNGTITMDEFHKKCEQINRLRQK